MFILVALHVTIPPVEYLPFGVTTVYAATLASALTPDVINNTGIRPVGSFRTSGELKAYT